MGRTLGMRIHRGECSYVYEYLRLYCMTYRKKINCFSLVCLLNCVLSRPTYIWVLYLHQAPITIGLRST
jgi:hypothetical protein